MPNQIRSRQRRCFGVFSTLVILASMLSMAFFVFSGVIGLASGQSPILHDWLGYNGNQTVYLTQDPQSFPILDQEGGSPGASNYQLSNNNSLGIPNALQLNLSTTSPNSSNYYYASQDPSHHFWIELYLSSVGVSNQWTQQYPGISYGTGWQEMGIQTQINGTGASSVVTQWQSYYNSGLNATTGADNGKSYDTLTYAIESGIKPLLLLAELSGIDGVGAFGYPFSLGIGAAGLLLNGPFPSNINQFGGPGSNNAWMKVDNGTTVDSNSPAGDNVFGIGAYVLIQISNFPSVVQYIGPSTITLFAQNEVLENTKLGYQYQNGTSTEFNINLSPAVSIGGYVNFASGFPAANVPVILVQKMNNELAAFQLMTNSSGGWHFFAMPGATYSVSASYTDVLGSYREFAYE